MAPIAGAPWTGPSTATMLQSHTLAHEIIARHDDPCPVLDGAELALLHDYLCVSADIATGVQRARQAEMSVGLNSLVAFVIRREMLGEVLLDDGEKAVLRGWFAAGSAEERIREWREGEGLGE
jgi:hypothetical protein